MTIPRSILLPNYLQGQAWTDLMDAVDFVFKDRIDDPTVWLSQIREKYLLNTEVELAASEGRMVSESLLDRFDRETRLQSLAMAGLRIPESDKFLPEHYERIQRGLATYWYSKGTGSVVDFISYVLNVPVTMAVMWTNNYSDFLVEGDPGIGVHLYEGGDWYPTTHIQFTYNPTGATPIPLSTLLSLFYSVANYVLVVGFIALELYMNVVHQDEPNEPFPNFAGSQCYALAWYCEVDITIYCEATLPPPPEEWCGVVASTIPVVIDVDPVVIAGPCPDGQCGKWRIFGHDAGITTSNYIYDTQEEAALAAQQAYEAAFPGGARGTYLLTNEVMSPLGIGLPVEYTMVFAGHEYKGNAFLPYHSTPEAACQAWADYAGHTYDHVSASSGQYVTCYVNNWTYNFELMSQPTSVPVGKVQRLCALVPSPSTVELGWKLYQNGNLLPTVYPSAEAACAAWSYYGGTYHAVLIPDIAITPTLETTPAVTATSYVVYAVADSSGTVMSTPGGINGAVAYWSKAVDEYRLVVAAVGNTNGGVVTMPVMDTVLI